jgi:hypothetical protein
LLGRAGCRQHHVSRAAPSSGEKAQGVPGHLHPPRCSHTYVPTFLLPPTQKKMPFLAMIQRIHSQRVVASGRRGHQPSCPRCLGALHQGPEKSPDLSLHLPLPPPPFSHFPVTFPLALWIGFLAEPWATSLGSRMLGLCSTFCALL